MSVDVQAGASIKLADRIPNASQLTDLTGQLTAQVKGIKVPGMPLDQIQQLTAGLNLKLPDTSNWHTAIPTDVNSLVLNFPSPDTLSKPLHEPLTKIKDVFTFDFVGELARLQEGLQGIPSAPTTSPDALLEGLLVPLDEIARLIQDPALKSLLDILASLLGVNDLAQAPQTAAGLLAQLKPVLHDRVEGMVLALLSIGSAMTATEQTERIVQAVAGAFSPEANQTRFNALLAQYGDASTGLAAQINALNPTDAAQVAGLQTRLQLANDVFAAYTSGLVRDLAFTEASLAVLNTQAIADRFKVLSQTIARVDADQLSALANSLQTLLGRIKDSLKLPTDVTLEQYKSFIHSGLTQLNEELTKFDPARIDQALKDVVKTINEPFHKLEEFKAEVETIVRGAFQTVSDAIDKIDLKPLQTLVNGALGELDAGIKELEALFTGIRTTIQTALDDVKKVLDDVKTFVLDPNTGLKKKIDDVFNTLDQVLKEVNLKAVVDQISAAIQPISSAVVQIQFTPIVDAVIQALDAITEVLKTVGPLLVTDALKQKLSEATEFLRKLDFDSIGKTLTNEFDAILKGVNTDALGSFKQEYQKVIGAIDQLDPAPLLAEIQRDVFDPLLTELEKIQPAELLKPVSDGYTAALAELHKFSPADTFSFISKFFEELLAKFHSISPAQLLEPVESALVDIRNQINRILHIDQALDLLDKLRSALTPMIEALDFSPILAQMSAGYNELKAALSAFDGRELLGPLATVLDGLFAQTGANVNQSGLLSGLSAISRGGDLDARYATMQASLQSGLGTLNALDVQSQLATLRSKHAEVRRALGTVNAPSNISLQVDLLDPMPVVSPLLPKVDRVKTAYAAKSDQFGQAINALGPSLQSVGKILQVFGALLSPLALVRDMLLAPVHQLLPGRTFTSTRDMLLAFVEQLDPSQWQAEIQALTTTIHTKLRALLDDAVLNPIAETLHSIKGMVDLFSIQPLLDAINGVFAEVESKIQQLNPAPLIKALDDDYRRILAAFETLNPAEFITEIDQLYTQDVVGVVRAISPQQLLLPPLEKLFAEIKGMLVVIDVEVLFKPVLDHLGSLEGQLGDGMHRIEGSYKSMLDALDAATGSAGASVSVSASVSAGG